MAELPQFTFAPSEEANALRHSLPINIAAKRQTPPVRLRTEPGSREDFAFVVPGRNHSRSSISAQLSTPPDSPNRLQPSAMSARNVGIEHDEHSSTPPSTPTSSSHLKTGSSSPELLCPLSNLHLGDNTMVSLTEGKPSGLEEPGSTKLITFSYSAADYAFRTDTKGRKKSIGEGAWSDVYLATPTTLPNASDQSLQEMIMTGMSPPLTPVHSRDSSLASYTTSIIPPLYAIKAPAMTSAKKVLAAEAEILSYLSRFPNAHKHIVPFFGLDSRTGSLVLEAMDGTLESWIAKELNTLSEASRAAKVAKVFPGITLALIDGLEWMQNKSCIQADIKPSNILVQASTPGVPKAVYTDFSSAILTIPGASVDAVASPLGAGTWDYLDPKLLSTTAPAPLSVCTDLWSLAITVLYLVIGRSPYEAFKGNKYQQREMIKSGSPLQCLGHDDMGTENLKRLSALSKALDLDVNTWFAKVLVKDQTSRASLSEWRGALVTALAAKASTI